MTATVVPSTVAEIDEALRVARILWRSALARYDIEAVLAAEQRINSLLDRRCRATKPWT